jgi:hypothetical protein
VETAYLHLKKTLRGARRVLRGQSVTLARQEVWAFLLVHNMIATLAARAAALAGGDSDTCRPVPAARTAAGTLSTPSPACSPTSSPIPGTAPAGSEPPAVPLPNGAPRHTEEATDTITITPSNLPQWDESLGS